MSVSQEIQELFSAYLDGELSNGQWTQLEAWLAADSTHALQFLQWMSLQSWTFEALRTNSLEQVLRDSESSGILSTLCDDRQEVLQRTFSKTSNQSPTRIWKLVTTLAIACAVLVMVWAPRKVRKSTPEPHATQSSQPSASTNNSEAAPDRDENSVAATVVPLGQCVWQDDKTAHDDGDQLNDGSRLTLRSGTVRVTFESGAQVLLEGPCDFTVDNAMHGTINSGRLSATVPSRAFGFRIRSPEAEVIDLGTEFGVAVDQNHCEVHVFKGEVLSRQMDVHGEQQGELFHITANDALRFSDSTEPPRRMASNTAKFAGRLASQPLDPSRSALPITDGLALWLAADKGVRTERDQRVVAWPDILVGDNVTAEDALQPDHSAQPRLLRKGLHGKPAVRFIGSSAYLVTTPLETTDNQTILLVCQFHPRAAREQRKRGGQILNYNGPPHRLVSSTFEPGVLQIGEPIVEDFAPTRLGGKVFSGRLNGRDVSEAEIYAKPIGPGRPVILAYTYDLASRQASLRCDGELIDVEPALRPAGVTSRKVIGRHGFMKYFFDGDLAELIIYNRALPPEHLRKASEYLSKKYRIDCHEEGLPSRSL
jgi:hypothetical protein